MRKVLLLLGFVLCLASPLRAGELVMPKPADNATCPVCGMFVAQYPEWLAGVVYKDGHAHYFDGPKDMFKYLLDLSKYAPGHSKEQIQVILVTDYYGTAPMDAREAFFVAGSDVLGPMGHEFVPLANKEEAAEFSKDHAGKKTLRFNEITPAMLDALDRGKLP